MRVPSHPLANAPEPARGTRDTRDFSPAARRARRSARFGLLAVLILAALTVLLWCAAVPQLHASLTDFGATRTVPADVVSCPRDGVLSPQCHVAFDDGGEQVVQQLTYGGLFGVEEGDRVVVHLAGDGTTAVGGWRPYADSVLFLALALAFTSYTLRRFAHTAGPRDSHRSTAAGHHGSPGSSARLGPRTRSRFRPTRRSRSHPAA